VFSLRVSRVPIRARWTTPRPDPHGRRQETRQKDDRKTHSHQGDPDGLAGAPADGQDLLGDDEQRHAGHRRSATRMARR
jgi:hypothetical protein